MGSRRSIASSDSNEFRRAASLILNELIQLVLFASLFTGYQALYRYVQVDGVINNLIHLLVLVGPPFLIFRNEKMWVRLPVVLASSAMNVALGLYILAAVFHDGL
tara:strand:- start:13891 stop:14205 length:315 start_codon:yes stop_codon:yes gene_type:complete